MNDLLTEVATERDSLRAALKSMLATAKERSRQLRRIDQLSASVENDNFASTLEAVLRGVRESRRGTCPACFGKGTIRPDARYREQTCELCQGSGKWWLRPEDEP